MASSYLVEWISGVVNVVSHFFRLTVIDSRGISTMMPVGVIRTESGAMAAYERGDEA